LTCIQSFQGWNGLNNAVDVVRVSVTEQFNGDGLDGAVADTTCIDFIYIFWDDEKSNES
jgi:hypothetical protein